MKMKEFGPPGGARVPGAPLRSANDTAWNRDREWDEHNRKQCLHVPVPVQCVQYIT